MKKQRMIGILAVLCVLSVAVMIYALLSGGKTEPFLPPPFDPSAQTGAPAVPEGLGYQTLDAGPFRVAVCGEIGTEGTEAVAYLTNPPDNEVWIKGRLLNETGEILGETGLIRPGEYVRSIPLRILPEPGTAVILKVMTYEPDTYHSLGAVSLKTRIGE